MALPIIAGTVRASFRGLMPSGRQWANVWHARYAGGASSPGPSDIIALDAILTRLYTGAAYGSGVAWLPACNTGVTLIDATYYVLNGTATAQIINHTAAGSLAAISLPPEVAHVVTNRTSLRGRSYRGRTYLPCVTVNGITTGGNLTAAIVTSTLAQLVGIKAALGGAGAAPFWELGVASYLHSTFQTNDTFTMDVKPDVQRRRK